MKNSNRQCTFPECEGVYHAKGYCSKHYARMRFNSGPVDSLRDDETLQQRISRRLCSYTPNINFCWEVPSSMCPDGRYGRMTFKGRSYSTHRAAYEAVYGAIPKNHVVMHLCDNPPCINPHHLRHGTQAENLQDARNKGRL